MKWQRFIALGFYLWQAKPVVSSKKPSSCSTLQAAVRALLAAILCLLWLDEAQSAPKRFTSYYGGATVFRDKNFNGAPDPDENSITTAANGRFVPPRGKGPLTLIGGRHIKTNQENRLRLVAPPRARGIGTLTTLWQALLDRKLNQRRVKNVLRVPAGVTLVDFSVKQVNKKNAKTETSKLLKRDAQHDTLVQFLKGLSLGAPRREDLFFKQNAPAAASPKIPEDPVIQTLADILFQLTQQGRKKINVADFGTIQNILDLSKGPLNVDLSPQESDDIAKAASGLNRGIDKHPENLDAWFFVRDCSVDGIVVRSFNDLLEACTAVSAPAIDATPISGSDTTPTISGSAGRSVVKVRLYRNNVQVADVVVRNGRWTYTSPVLRDGIYTFVAVGINARNELGEKSAEFIIVINTTLFPAPNLTGFGEDTGTSATDFTTWDNTPTLTGTVDPRAKEVHIITHSGAVDDQRATLLVNAGGIWSYTFDPPLPDDTYTVTLFAVNAAGKLGRASVPLTFVVDREANWDSSLWDNVLWGP